MNNTLSLTQAAAGPSEAPVRPVTPAPADVAATLRPRLRALTGAASAKSTLRKRFPLLGPIVFISIILLTLALELTLSLLNSQAAYDLRALGQEQRDLGRVQRLVQQNVEMLASPQNLATNAQALGMVQNSTPATLRLSDGTILGELKAATNKPKDNLVANSTLETLPIVDASGDLIERAGQKQTMTPEVWKGKLPAPTTH